MRHPTRRPEGLWHRQGLRPVAGVDEAGRGCLAGPVVAGAVILGTRVPSGIDDSKRLSPARREELLLALEASRSHHLAWGLADPSEIDRLNIRQASFLAMNRAISHLPEPPAALLVDGEPIPDLDLPQRGLIRGDQRSLSIAAASIVAKVIRDHMMVELARRYPAYGFEHHKGYPTAEHLEALRRLGPCPHHRRTYTPVRQAFLSSTGPGN